MLNNHFTKEINQLRKENALLELNNSNLKNTINLLQKQIENSENQSDSESDDEASESESESELDIIKDTRYFMDNFNKEVAELKYMFGVSCVCLFLFVLLLFYLLFYNKENNETV
jgi:hypothetical protein